MGRQAHLTRLELGRSPYGDPFRDSDGNFIMSRHAHDVENSDYRQQFDDRGHPRNPSSKASARELRRAQNDVLAAVGVVVRKDEATKSEWEKLTPSRKRQLVSLENMSGRELKTIDRVTGLITTWSLAAFRHRSMTFDFYQKVPLSFAVWYECRLMGLHQFFTSGLPIYLVSTLPQMYRYYVRNPDVEDAVNFVNPAGYPEYLDLRSRLFEQCAHALAFCLEMPLKAFSSLQLLQIVPNSTWMPLSFLVPFSSTSPIRLPQIPRILSLSSSLQYLYSCSTTPFVISMVHDHLHVHIGYRLYSLLRQTMLYADRPDMISVRVSDETEIIEDTSIPGIGFFLPVVDQTRPGRYYGPRSFWGAFRRAFPTFYIVLNFLAGGKIAKSPGRLDPPFNDHLIRHVQAAYQSRNDVYGPAPTPGSMSDVAIQREITYKIFESVSMDPDEELVDPFAWTVAALASVEDSSLSQSHGQNELQDLEELLSPTGIQSYSNSPRAFAQRSMTSNIETSPETSRSLMTEGEPTLPSVSVFESSAEDTDISIEPQQAGSPFEQYLEAEMTLSGINRGTEVATSSSVERAETRELPSSSSPEDAGDTAALLSPENVAEGEPPAPAPIIHRATPSFADIDFRQVSQDMDTDLASTLSVTTSREVLSAARKHHRMTLLTAFAVDSFAWHSSAIITKIILLPIESLYLRSLAGWALKSNLLQAPGSFASTSALLTSVDGVLDGGLKILGLGDWFGGPSRSGPSPGRISYASTILLTIGLEILVRGGLWYLGTRRALHRGILFGWGKF